MRFLAKIADFSSRRAFYVYEATGGTISMVKLWVSRAPDHGQIISIKATIEREIELVGLDGGAIDAAR